MILPRWVPILLLACVALGTSWLLWRMQGEQAPPPLEGPPRSDYQLRDFEMTALDESGAEAFRVSGPALARHPYLGTLEVEQPRFLFPDSEGRPWNASAGRAWVASDGKELRLRDAVAFDGPPAESGGRIELRTPAMSVFPETRELRNDVAVTVTAPGSILRGRGLHAELDARRFRLSQVTGRYAPSSP